MIKILKLQAENIKKIKVIDITPKDNTVKITGKNGAGKSSALDCISYAIAGTRNIDPKPIRDGETEGKISLDLGDKIVVRKFKLKEDGGYKTKLILESEDGATYSKPQEIMDKITSNLSFDPLAFANMKPKEQFEELKKVVKIDFDFEKNEGLKKTAFDERTFVNREIKQLEGEILGIEVPENTPEQEINVSELSNKLKRCEDNKRNIKILQNNLIEINEKMSDLRHVLEMKKQELQEVENELNNLEPIEEKEIKEIQDKINNSTQINKSILDKKRKSELSKKLEDKKSISNSFTEKLDNIEKEKIDAISKVKMPVDKLTFGDGQILYDNIPLEQVNSAKKLEISCRIAMSSNSELKVILIKNGSLLDNDSLKIIENLAKEKDYQIWIEKVDDTGKVGIVMEDGEITKVN